jgi:phosphotransferase system enzyme I (PtsI)
MIEVPAAAVCADLFAREVDFLSIGTNDLIQYTLAIDRTDDEVNYLFDPLNPAVIRLIQNTLQAGRKGGVPVAMCGEMAGNPRYTRLLLGLGLREFSVPPNALLEIKQIISTSDTAELAPMVRRMMRTTDQRLRASIFDAVNNARSSTTC